ncbi:unnamed protein product [Durusdinium trenchii]|uniref:Amine oxidase n=1 Tax=Durusdinium trenchii TaxID=1381693 RepID=A0ABP0QFF7_9DINO
MAKWTMTHFVLSAALGHALAYLATSVDVLVVGAGQAGMSAAYALRKMGLSVQILEATDHVGGRTRNVDVRTGQSDVETDDVIETWVRPVGGLVEYRIKAWRFSTQLGGSTWEHRPEEIGGTWLSPEHSAALRLATELLGRVGVVIRPGR